MLFLLYRNIMTCYALLQLLNKFTQRIDQLVECKQKQKSH